MHEELSVKSRVRGDFHARFCERVRVKLPRSTRPLTLEVVGVMQFVFLTYWDNLEAASLDIFHKRLVALHLFVFLGAWLASVYVAGYVLRGGRSGITQLGQRVKLYVGIVNQSGFYYKRPLVVGKSFEGDIASHGLHEFAA